MSDIVLGLDIGGANLKAATPDKRARSVPFPLWKQPDALPAALASLVAQFPDATELAVTMTGELCDCFETKREGVAAIINAVRFASAARRIRVWSTDGAFLDSEQAKANHLKVAAANWHALATFAGRCAPTGGALLIDIGSTTTDIIPLCEGLPHTYGTTDDIRLANDELKYVGVRRTPLCAVGKGKLCAELFATTQDVFVVLTILPEEPDNRDTADGRPLTCAYSLARLARMLGGDRELISEEHLIQFAATVYSDIKWGLAEAVREVHFNGRPKPPLRTVIVSGSGEVLARDVIESAFLTTITYDVVSLNDQLGPEVSACAPAYAVAVLAAEARA